MELLVAAVRNDDWIKGIKLKGVDQEGKEVRVKVCSFCDDLLAMIGERVEWKMVVEKVETYCRATQAKLNVGKSIGMELGRWREEGREAVEWRREAKVQ